jgi:hypothetical protein
VLAANCLVPIAKRLLDEGVIAIGEVTVTVAEAVRLPPRFGGLIARAVTAHEVVGESGALNRPAAEIVPHVALQVEGELAVNCCVAFSSRVTFAGLTLIARAETELNAMRADRIRGAEYTRNIDPPSRQELRELHESSLERGKSITRAAAERRKSHTVITLAELGCSDDTYKQLF